MLFGITLLPDLPEPVLLLGVKRRSGRRSANPRAGAIGGAARNGSTAPMARSPTRLLFVSEAQSFSEKPAPGSSPRAGLFVL
jgi:hypothetical protein